MNTYRKTYSNKVTFTQAGVIETPRNRMSDTGLSGWGVEIVKLVVTLSIAIATLMHFGLL